MSALKRVDRILSAALIEKGLLSKGVVEPVLREVESSEETFAGLLVARNLLRERDVLNVLSSKLGLAIVDLEKTPVDKSVIEKVPVKIASYYRFMPVEIKERVLTVAVSYPLDIKTQDEIRIQLGYDVEMVLAPSDEVKDGLKRYYGLGADTLHEISSQRAAVSPEAGTERTHDKVEDIDRLVGDASVIRLVNQIILEGWRKRATDIHIEPFRGGVALRYRIDGVLYDANVPAEMKHFLNAIISRIKIMSNLNIVERRLPQDGRAVVKVQNQMLDLRISTMPTHFGESVVIRILPTQMLYSLQKLGLSKKDLHTFEHLVLKPHGIIFITGPTGSGKTTTLYACLSRINTKERKIITLEDPIEYEIQGITQIQILPEIDLGFARGLRSVLRHDPDVIMVGEVRDLETAEIAVRVALTGHLVFSTLHTNDAASGITRLVDIGVEPYLVASSIEAFIAQRLIRVICEHCKHEDKTAPKELKDMIARDLKLSKAEKVRIYRGKGCPHCNFTGFYGRTAMYEILPVDEAIKTLILKKAHTGQIKREAVSKGMQTLREDGWHKVIAGVTTPEEVMKVTPAEEDGSEEMRYIKSERGEEVRSMPPSAKADRRVYRRLNKKINIRYKVFKSTEDIPKKWYVPENFSVSKNISAGGILFVTDTPLVVNAILELKLELPDGEAAIESLAKVVRVERMEEEDRYDTAVCFLDITGAERARLDKYVERTEQ